MRNIIPRKLNLKFSEEIPKYWMKDSIFKTHFLNSLTLVFPAGEKYFIRSINKFRSAYKDPVLKEEIKAFIQQETYHSNEHEKFFKNLKTQGFDIEPFVQVVENIIKNVLEPLLGEKLNLATTAGLEHFTALLAEIGLKEQFLKDAHPVMKELFEWHAAEEIEHRTVAYDALQSVDDSYILRITGLVLAYLLLSGFVSAGTIFLLVKDKKLLDKKVYKDGLDTLIFKEQLFIKSIEICFRYIRPDFHPGEHNTDELKNDVFGLYNYQGAV